MIGNKLGQNLTKSYAVDIYEILTEQIRKSCCRYNMITCTSKMIGQLPTIIVT